ncbi:hypothetical protein [Senegalia massiliensis]|jgi:hypothetical protein|uniref:hypothetical protein n=1 Tax=Senegalia massiliensis TaxID=1720316 RepID=UPI001030F4AB|nr:hypothetical protein [Senegalia massiliensis]
MVKFICGRKGSGKTKQLINMANDSAENVTGGVVFIEATNKHSLELNYKIRYINAMEFNIDKIDTFYGLLCGIVASDYDVQKVYIDGLYKMIELDFYLLEKFIEYLKVIDKYNETEFIISVECEKQDVPENMKKYLVN